MLTLSQESLGAGRFRTPASRPLGPRYSELRRLSQVDLPAVREFAEHLSSEDVYRRFGTSITDTDSLARRLTLLGRADSETYAISDADGSMAALGNLVPTAAGEAEIALIVRSDLKRHGLGTSLLQGLAARARASGTRRLYADVLNDNAGMIGLARRQGAIFDGFSGLHVELHFDLLPQASTSTRVNFAHAQAWSLQ